MKSAYAKELSAYDASDLAVRAEMKPRCDGGPEGKVLPVTFHSNPPPGRLFAFLNVSTPSLTARLIDSSGSTVSNGACTTTAEGANTAYTRVCEFDTAPAELARVTALKVVEIGSTGSPESQRYPIALNPTP